MPHSSSRPRGAGSLSILSGASPDPGDSDTVTHTDLKYGRSWVRWSSWGLIGLVGDISRVGGRSDRVIGDVSHLGGDLSGVGGDVSHLRGWVPEGVRQSAGWPPDGSGGCHRAPLLVLDGVVGTPSADSAGKGGRVRVTGSCVVVLRNLTGRRHDGSTYRADGPTRALTQAQLRYGSLLAIDRGDRRVLLAGIMGDLSRIHGTTRGLWGDVSHVTHLWGGVPVRGYSYPQEDQP